MNKILLIALGATVLLGATTFLLMNRTKTVDSSAYPAEIVDAFKSWADEYGKKYADPDFEAYRLGVFATNYKTIQAHPKSASYTLGQNQFMDLTNEEFKQTYLGLIKKDTKSAFTHVNSGKEVASSIDWNAKGDVQAVKNQGQCGSCWAFSTVASLEACDAIFGKGLGDFSEQQLVSCSSSYGNMGCNGGLMDYAFQYVIDNGITSESDYAYTATTGTCNKAKIESPLFKISKYTDVASGNCDDLKDALNQQPVSIGVDAETWQFYSGGVFDNCGTQLDHGVLANGYDSSSNWSVKNSWGASWGEKGYITLKSGNTCGICNTASYPSI